MAGMKHVYRKRDDDLSWCSICDCAEGELLSYCPGYPLNEETRLACYQGNVLDFTWEGIKLRVNKISP